ncbi:hypothetical protein M513_02829 [Trichuris suis]|uniref:Uncharacterized protein n=1 Tax=Trichuris suis TaxID=68888 RepID=A0A085MGM8_9BILA|nr:hypothetical protein M513_02829 [Trichuris suis]
MEAEVACRFGSSASGWKSFDPSSQSPIEFALSDRVCEFLPDVFLYLFSLHEAADSIAPLSDDLMRAGKFCGQLTSGLFATVLELYL